MLLLILLLFSGITAIEIPKEVKLYVGQVYSLSLPQGSRVEDASGGPISNWLTLDIETLMGLPQGEHVGKHYVKVTHPNGENVIEFKVSEEFLNPCGETDSFWVEVLFEGSKLVQDKVRAAKMVHDFTEVDLEKIRVYTPEYGKAIRDLTKLEMNGNDESLQQGLEDLFHVVVPGDCAEGNEQEQDLPEKALQILEIIFEKQKSGEISAVNAEIFQGRVRSRQERQGVKDIISNFDFATSAPDIVEEDFEVTTLTTTTKRSVRPNSRGSDSSPQKLGSLSSMKCYRGILCSMTIPSDTFMDPEDGKTEKLKLEVKSNGADEKWVKVDKMQISAVPLKEGEFQMRLEARDKNNQMVSAPFNVLVEDSSIPNHKFFFEMDTLYDRYTSNPHLLVGFVQRLASAFKASTDSVMVDRVEKSQTGKAVIYWSNANLSTAICPTDEIEAMKLTMATKKQNNPKGVFMKAMGPEYMVRKLGLNFTGACLPSASSDSSSPSVVSPNRESGFGWLALAAALALLLLLIALALCCCLAKRPKKEKPSEFVSKGLPVVFPEEVADESETAIASTPMLVKEERPPLKVSQHENPLYKPPPPLTSSFSPRGTTPGLAGTPSQRLPPPYVPP
ncbi:unnamed protein product, partial [Mesorhabditis belari]|uniref:Peptidase S72 domain-containing protein n=1 Tax=Mesorhabditis belari TaxID=2138241 RepID=A0AAF3FPN0_9BILA